MYEREREIDYGLNFPHLPVGTPTAMALQKLLSRGQVYFPPLAFGLVFDFLLANKYSRSNDIPVAQEAQQLPLFLRTLSSCHMNRYGLAFSRLRDHMWQNPAIPAEAIHH